ncbi:MAG: 50S ribosomal protein L25/general stress protein Ctc [Legionellales bacterium RIFCSPHIGHO2_12_FULL_35_11]|nr:MAG: 50S ribosomal protein L25/general stress protein Ctc [Legionellales bacterium RIFCSPHIGHO2_12_FULL_35_11]
MSTLVLEAEVRDVMGKGASRRLRRLESKVPGIVYGSSKKPQLLNLAANKVTKILENEAIYSSVFSLSINGKYEQVILKDLQRHPYKPEILHIDFQRVSGQDVLVRMVPIHFINDEKSIGHKEGGVVNHSMTQIEITCKAKDLPEFIEVDLIDLKLDEVFHLSHVKLPKNVSLTVDVSDHDHDLPVAGIHISKAALSEEALEAEEKAEALAAKAEEEVEEGASSEDNKDTPAEEAEEE